MDIQLFEGLKYYINNHRIPSNLSSDVKKQIRNKSHDYTVHRDKLYFIHDNEFRLVVREDELMNVLHDGHSGTYGGHFSTADTYSKLKRDFYWPRMYSRVDQYVKTCEACQRRGKPQRNEQLHSISVKEPFELIGIDCVGPLPETTSKNKYIIVMTEYLTKWVEAQAVPDIKASTIAEFIYNDVITRHGTPKTILTDQGSSFRNEVVDSLCKVMGIKHALTSAYHPQTNGLTERFNATLCEMIAKFILEQGGEWDKWISSALFAYRQKKHASTKFSPSFLLYGREIKTPLTLIKSHNSEEDEFMQTAEGHANLITQRLLDARIIAKRNNDKAQQRQKESYDKRVKPKKFNIGTKVLLYDSASQNVHGDKFRNLYTGPYIIRKAYDNGTYQLMNEQGITLRKAINGNRLKQFFERPAWEPMIIINQDVEERIKIGNQIR